LKEGALTCECWAGPNVKVSWQVTGIRQDAYANAHRVQVEDKPPQE